MTGSADRTSGPSVEILEGLFDKLPKSDDEAEEYHLRSGAERRVWTTPREPQLPGLLGPLSWTNKFISKVN